jgi:trehalose 6-phosphate synthase/phosphatase
MNRLIAEGVAHMCKEADIAWIHGYELMMMAQELGELVPNVRKVRDYRRFALVVASPVPPILVACVAQIFFMHAPFPTSEVFRALSIRDDLINSLLASNIVGFHSFCHARHFMQSCKRIAGLSFQSRVGGRLGVEYEGRCVLSVCVSPSCGCADVFCRDLNLDCVHAPGTLWLLCLTSAWKSRHCGDT